jgi:glutathione S-transferase
MIMQLYVTFTSPYARLARILVLEKSLQERVEVIGAQTRTLGSPYYAINPSGRVPYLIDDAGVGMEDSQLICAYLDNLDGKPRFHRPSSERDWAYDRLEAKARSLCDGIAVWAREMSRPEGERSRTVLAHEAARAQRLADLFETEAGTTLLQEAPAMGHLVLAVALEFARDRGFGDLTDGRPQLSVWFARMRRLRSLQATASPASRGSEARK